MSKFHFLNPEKNIDAMIAENNRPNSNLKTIIKQYNIAMTKGLVEGVVYGLAISALGVGTLVVVKALTPDTETTESE